MLSTEPAPYVMIFRCVFQNGIPDAFKCLATSIYCIDGKKLADLQIIEGVFWNTKMSLMFNERNAVILFSDF